MGEPRQSMEDSELISLLTTTDYFEAQTARGTLESAGVEVVVTGEALQTGVWGAVPLPGGLPIELFVPRAQIEQARRVLESIAREDGPPQDPWICGHCGTVVEAVFGVCWKCGQPAV